MEVTKRESCRICGSKALTQVLDLGSQLLATLTVTEENKDRISRVPVPLEVVRCNPQKDKTACGLVQLLHTYPGDFIYREYWYRSGINQTMRDALKDIVLNAKKRVDLKPHDCVIDIGCNDGTLLNSYERSDITRIGFDPVENIRGENETFHRITDYFNGPRFLKDYPDKKAKIISSIAMFYDLEDPNQFVSDIAQVLHPEGIWIVQIADLPEMLEQVMFDQIVHEHLEYYHIRPFLYLIDRHGLKLVDIEKNKSNGSSYRFYVRPKAGSSVSPEAEKRIAGFLKQEEAMQLESDAPYARFNEACQKIKKDLVTFIHTEKAKGKKIYAYGASTKGNVILQYCGLTNKDIPFVADRNPLKFGGKTIGSEITIISEEQARNDKPDYMLVLPYYFLDEMIKRERAYLENGGKFVIPLPALRIIDKSVYK